MGNAEHLKELRFQGLAPRLELDGQGTAHAIQNFIAKHPSHSPIEVSHLD